jgi:hypothetical protein
MPKTSAEKSRNSFVFREEDNRDLRTEPESVATLSQGGGFQPVTVYTIPAPVCKQTALSRETVLGGGRG